VSRTLKRIAALKRDRASAKRSREERAARMSSKALAMALPPLMQWIPQVSPELDEPRHLPEIVQLFEDIHAGKVVECGVSVPPRHGKTVTALHGIVWLLGQHPEWQILYVSYSLSIAKKMVRRAKKIALQMGLKLGGTQTREHWETAAGGGLRASGLGGQLVGDGFHVIFVDDPHKNRKEAESPVILQRVIDGFWSDVYTRKVPARNGFGGTSTIVNHQRWGLRDLIGAICTQSEENPQPFRLINLPAIREDGTALAPLIWPLAELLKIKAKDLYAWLSMYMGDPRVKGGKAFATATLTSVFPSTARATLGADFARSAKQRSDHHAMVHMVWEGPIATIIDVIFQRGHLTDMDDAGVIEEGVARPMYRMQRRAGGATARWYAGRDETTYSDLLAGLAEPVYVNAFKADNDKWVRAQPYASAWNDGRIRVLSTCRYLSELLAQHRDFTGREGAVDDIVDACVAAYDEGMGSSVPSVVAAMPRHKGMQGLRGMT
jgi:hypothetical protein